MRRTSHFLVYSFAVLMVLTAAGCNRATEAPAATAMPPFMTDYTIKDLMLNVIDTNADVVWLSVTTVASAEGLVETRPTTDEEWAKVHAGAITLAEAANLLMIPGRRVARPGEKSETPGVELEPEEMDVLIAKDRAGWNKRVLALHEAAEASLRAIDAHDADKVFELGEQIENACEGCHSQYWYPNEKI